MLVVAPPQGTTMLFTELNTGSGAIVATTVLDLLMIQPLASVILTE